MTTQLIRTELGPELRSVQLQPLSSSTSLSLTSAYVSVKTKKLASWTCHLCMWVLGCHHCPQQGVTPHCVALSTPHTCSIMSASPLPPSLVLIPTLPGI